MLIDWFTVAAQVVNFLILVWLLKRFLYKPILDTIDEREKKVKDRLNDAEAKKNEAEKKREDFQHKKDDLDKHRTETLNQAKADANVERQRLLDAARKEYDEKRSQYNDSLLHEEEQLIQVLSSRTRKEVFAIARKTLADLAGTQVEESIVNISIQRLSELNSQEKERLVADFRSAPRPVIVRTSANLLPEQQAAVEKALEDVLGAKPQCQFETLPDLIGGIEITLGGKKIAWSISDYLASLENSVHEILKKQPEGSTPPKPAQELNSQINGASQNKQTGAAEHG